MPLPDLDLLVAVVDHGNLTAAAEHLGMPRPTLSRRLAQLEEDLGVRLVHRSTRRVVPTEAGEQLYRHARPIVDAVDAARDALRARDGVPRGLLRVSIPGANPTFARCLTTFAAKNPEVRLEVVATARHVDLVAEQVDVALRAGSLTGTGLLSRKLFTTRQLVVGSPAYLAEHGLPAAAADLVAHAALTGFARGEVPTKSWPLLDGGTVEVTPRLTSNDPEVLLQGALDGLGLALLPQVFASGPLATGALVPVLPEHVGQVTGAWLVYPEKRLMVPRVRAFIDHVVAWLAEHPIV